MSIQTTRCSRPMSPRTGSASAYEHPLCADRRLRERALHRQSGRGDAAPRSEEHTSELQSLMRISYAVFCLKKKTKSVTTPTIYYTGTLSQRQQPADM